MTYDSSSWRPKGYIKEIIPEGREGMIQNTSSPTMSAIRKKRYKDGGLQPLIINEKTA
jgi:hypothetical protein